MKRRVSNVRIVAGKFKGLRIPFKASRYIRPTTNKTKETIFSWLQSEIDNSTCLDMFAGTGSLGLEAISRGASFVYFAEKNRKKCEQLYKTVIKLNIKNQSEILTVDSLKFPFEKRIKKPLDIVFIDPPFRLDYLKKAFSLIIDKKLITCNLLFVRKLKEKKRWKKYFQSGI
ncbi:MAG: ribosomal RNA small subunit methyltransferase D [Gammaproteobacteria bacterium]|nr:MAG: ribosomal RNA small subunit methyltransferase D [Gammaproteobacteria bacterium]